MASRYRSISTPTLAFLRSSTRPTLPKTNTLHPHSSPSSSPFSRQAPPPSPKPFCNHLFVRLNLISLQKIGSILWFLVYFFIFCLYQDATGSAVCVLAAAAPQRRVGGAADVVPGCGFEGVEVVVSGYALPRVPWSLISFCVFL